ncbi:MAG: bifunctional folylpolyglutamate synthase/dihydrofolate synthase [Flavobacteriales bacterium]|nr:bifunctional folylpolyglutamate synthase/dihydrofolate synthase [Flavobacteriales bacterium]
MDYPETLDYLFAQLPMYQRSGPAAYKASLDTTHAINDMLGNPHVGLKTVHIAGTNGKGSVASMIASVLQEAGYKTGLHTSPHLKDFRERIRINGEMIPHDEVIRFVEEYRTKWKPLQPSFFEITVGMAWWYFKRMEVDIVVVETGLGGRLDSTNVIIPEVSVITQIGMDHMNLLGNTIREIAAEKAGIIKPGIPVVLGVMEEEALDVLNQRAAECQIVVHMARDAGDDLPQTALGGMFQKYNVQTAMSALKVLKKNGWNISFEHVVNGLAQVLKNTGIKGRWQQLGESPLIFADGAHNVDGIQVILKEIERLHFTDLHVVLGVVKDKDLASILKLLPREASYYFCKADVPRGMAPEDLQEAALEYGLKGEIYPSVRRAYEAARLYATREDLIFIGGSFFTVAEIL